MEKFPCQILIVTLICSVLFFLFLPLVNAQIEPELEYPEAFGQEPTKSLPDFVNYIYRFAIGSAGFLAVMMLIIGGIKLMTSAGNPQKLENAKKQIQNSILGLATTLFSFFIISYINPDLLILRELPVQELSKNFSIDDAIKNWKEDHKLARGGKTTNLRIGAVYDAGKQIDCYKVMALIDPDKEETEEDQKERYLVRGDQEAQCGGPVSMTSDTDPILDGNKNHIYCCNWDYSLFSKLEEDYGDEEPKYVGEEEFIQAVKAESICEIGNSCTKIEGDQDICDEPKTCAEVKEMGLKSECNDNYIYCLTDAPPPSTAPSADGSSSENKEEEDNGGCPCDHPLEGPPNNGFTCFEGSNEGTGFIGEGSGYCAIYEVCFNKKCYDVREGGKCFCTNQSNYKCVRDTITPEGIRMIETIKTGSCKCSGITKYPKTPCLRETGYTPD